MESNEHQQRLRDLEKAQAAPYIHFRPTPWWWAPAMALWFTALVATGTVPWLDGDRAGVASNVARIAIVLVLGALAGVMVTWYKRYNGTLPSLTGQKPPEIRRAYVVYFVAAAITAGVVLALVDFAAWWITLPVTFVLTYALFAGYNWYYTKAAAAVQARLG